jgi:hypothetical protein
MAESPITGHNLQMDRVQSALPIPGSAPVFVMVNEGNDVVLVRRSGRRAGWDSERLPINLNWRRIDEEDRRQRLKIAAASVSSIAIFYISQGEGWLTLYDVSTTPKDILERIALEKFY